MTITPLVLGSSASTVVGSDIQAWSDKLDAIVAATWANNKLFYLTGTNTVGVIDFTAAGRALVDDADASAQLTTLGVSTYAKTLLDDADAATARATLGLGDVASPSRSKFRVFDHLDAAATQATSGTPIGSTRVWFASGGTAGTQVTQVGAAQARQGVADLETGTVSTGRVSASFLQSRHTFTAASSDLVVGATINIPTLSSAAELFEVRVGLLDNAIPVGAPANGLHFRLQNADANWETVNTRASAETVTGSGVAGSAGAWVNLKIVYTPGGNAVYYINGTQVASDGTNKPTDATVLIPVVEIVKQGGSTGTTTRHLYVDAMNWEHNIDTDLEQILA